MSRLSTYVQLKPNSTWFITCVNCLAEWTRALFRSSNARALINSRPRVERLTEIATFCAPDCAYPRTGPCTVVRKIIW